MIRPPGFRGAVFASAADGDGRRYEAARARLSLRLGISEEWSYPSQVHGSRVVRVSRPGSAGTADAVYTTTPDLPLAIATADCAPVILEGPGVVGIVHAGWRGAVAGVLRAVLDAADRDGLAIERAAIGPSIRPCCYEVGREVADRFGGHVGRTRDGGLSVDIAGYLEAQIEDLDVWRSEVCTYDSTRFHSFRRTQTEERQVALAWIPGD